MKEINGEKLYTSTEFQEMIGVSNGTFYKWKKRGLLVPSRFISKRGYYTEKDYANYLELVKTDYFKNYIKVKKRDLKWVVSKCILKTDKEEDVLLYLKSCLTENEGDLLTLLNKTVEEQNLILSLLNSNDKEKVENLVSMGYKGTEIYYYVQAKISKREKIIELLNSKEEVETESDSNTSDLEPAKEVCKEVSNLDELGEIYTVEEFAKKVGYNTDTIYRLSNSGDFKARRTVTNKLYYTEHDVKVFMGVIPKAERIVTGIPKE